MNSYEGVYVFGGKKSDYKPTNELKILTTT